MSSDQKVDHLFVRIAIVCGPIVAGMGQAVSSSRISTVFCVLVGGAMCTSALFALYKEERGVRIAKMTVVVALFIIALITGFYWRSQKSSAGNPVPSNTFSAPVSATAEGPGSSAIAGGSGNSVQITTTTEPSNRKPQHGKDSK
jgi:hypothetical protein